MTAVLPEFLPDELLYSTIARWRDRMLPRDQKTVLDELFGRPTGIAVVGFPGHLDAFLVRLPPRHPHEAEALLDRHTPLPYYAPFVRSERIAEVRSRLRRGGSGGIPDLLGIRASTVRSPRSLQFCPACAEYDHARFGEPYWHRCHQLPGVWVCHVHRAPLWTSGIRRSGGARRHVFRSLSLALASSTRPLDPPGEGGALWEWIAHETADLLTGGSRQMSGLAVRELCRDRLAELSLMRGRSQVRMTDLRIAFERHFGRQVLEAIGCGVRTASGEDDWLSRLLRKPRTAQHPLQHLLLMHFLGVEPQEQLARARSMPPRGVAGRAAAAVPTCPNPVCPEAGAAKRSARGQMKSPKRVECSACGMIYQSDPAGGGRVRVWVRGHAWEEKHRALVDDATVSLREIARRLGVTPKAIQGHARRLGVWREAWEASAEPMGGATDQVVLRSRTEAHRAEWLRLQAHHPDEGVKALRVRAPATYAHLYPGLFTRSAQVPVSTAS